MGCPKAVYRTSVCQTSSSVHTPPALSRPWARRCSERGTGFGRAVRDRQSEAVPEEPLQAQGEAVPEEPLRAQGRAQPLRAQGTGLSRSSRCGCRADPARSGRAERAGASGRARRGCRKSRPGHAEPRWVPAGAGAERRGHAREGAGRARRGKGGRGGWVPW